jgi:hypothetical protein
MLANVSARRIAQAAAVAIAGVLLLVWQIDRVGVANIRLGLAQVGWGFAAILAISLVRFVLRSAAWVALMDAWRSLGAAIGATLAGDAIGNLTPLSLIVSEPAKSIYLRDRVPGARSFAALTAENFFYSVSVAIFIMLGSAAMLDAFALPPQLRAAGIGSLVLMAAVLASALWIGWREPSLASAAIARIRLPAARALAGRVREFEASTYAFVRQRDRPLGTVIACETAFHLLSFGESYYTIWLITGRSAPLAALILDSVNRIVNVVFRAVPLRLGVDETGTAAVASAVGFSPALGVSLALVRKGRMLVWAAVGIALAARKGLSLRDVMALQPRREGVDR